MRHTLLVEVGGADDAAICIGLNPVNIAIGTDFAAAGFFGHANRGRQRAGFGANFAAEAFAKAALDASAAPGTRLGKNGHRRGERMPAELAPSSFKDNAA